MIHHRYIVTLHCDGMAFRYAIVVEGDQGPIPLVRADLAKRVDAPAGVIADAVVVECVETDMGIYTQSPYIEMLHVTRLK